MSKVSVVIAAYNVEEFLADTLNTVIAQTLKDIEIVIVNDCSTDGTARIIAEYAERDARIKVVSQPENSGLVRVRQAGLKAATGEYVMFLDGDDSLAPSACEKAYNAIVSEGVDMLQFDVEIAFSSDVKPSRQVVYDQKQARRSPKKKIVSGSSAGLIDQNETGDAINFTIWDKIYKKDLLEAAGRYVPDEYLNMAEDVLYSFLIQYHAKSFSYIPDELYKYRYGCGMSTTPKITEKLLKAIAKNAFVYNYLCDFTKEMNAESECKAALGRVHKQLYTHIVDAYIHCKTKEQRDLLLSEVLKYGNPEALVFTLSDYFYSELDGYRTSESYKIGMIVTYIPRKIVWFLRKIFKK